MVCPRFFRDTSLDLLTGVVENMCKFANVSSYFKTHINSRKKDENDERIEQDTHNFMEFQ